MYLIYFPKKGVFCVWHKTATDGEAPILKIRELWSNSLLPLLSGPLWPRIVVVPVKVTSMDQIGLFENYLYLTEPNTKKLLNNYRKKINMTVQWLWFPNLKA